MNQQHLNKKVSSTECSWNRQRSDAELTSFISRKLAALATVSLED